MPQFVEFMDLAMLYQYLPRRLFPVYLFLKLLPIRSVQEFIRASGDIYTVSVSACTLQNAH
jgi:hypothetical protein